MKRESFVRKFVVFDIFLYFCSLKPLTPYIYILAKRWKIARCVKM